jgi:putative hemolysin
MKKNLKTTFYLLIILLVLVGFYYFVFLEEETEVVIPEEETMNTQIANPASVYCEENEGTLEIRTAEDGSQEGFCLFEDGSECEEWTFFRGDCNTESSN